MCSVICENNNNRTCSSKHRSDGIAHCKSGLYFFGVGMVMMNAFNGAGDSRTPTWVNLFWFWIFQIPLAYLVAIVWHWGPKGVFISIVVTETCITITSVLLFRMGKWKVVKV